MLDLDHYSAAEKIGILGLIGGFLVACVKSIHFIANFSDEHQRFIRHLEETDPLVPRFYKMEVAIEQAKEERQELIAEVRGLRKDLMNYIIGKYGE